MKTIPDYELPPLAAPQITLNPSDELWGYFYPAYLATRIDENETVEAFIIRRMAELSLEFRDSYLSAISQANKDAADDATVLDQGDDWSEISNGRLSAASLLGLT